MDDTVTTTELERLVRDACPSGCGCVAADDADRRECACDGPCCFGDWHTIKNLAAEVLAGRKRDIATRDALREGCQGHSPTESPKCLYCQALAAMGKEARE